MIATRKLELGEHAAVFGANSYAGANHIDVARSGEGPETEVQRAGRQAGRLVDVQRAEEIKEGVEERTTQQPDSQLDSQKHRQIMWRQSRRTDGQTDKARD